MAKNQQTDPLEVLDNLKNFLGQIEKGSKEKADAFKQALMILSAPNSIAVSSQGRYSSFSRWADQPKCRREHQPSAVKNP